MKYEITLRINKSEMNRLKQMAEALEYDNEGELVTTLIERLLAGSIVDGNYYEQGESNGTYKGTNTHL